MTQNEQTFTVQGMTCGSCERKVTQEVQELDGVTAVVTDRSTGRLTVAGDVDVAAVRTAVRAAGHEMAA